MYAISSLNEGKYRVMSDSLTSAFQTLSDTPRQTSGEATAGASAPIVLPMRRSPTGGKANAATGEKRAKLRNLANQLNQALAPLVNQGQVRVTEGAQGIVVDINASVLFPSGEARLNADAVRALTAVSQVLAQVDYPLAVEGHTDNIPIHTAQFPSNWELSAGRAASVVRLFVESGIDPRRLTAVGYADQRPKADNATPEGRQENRRVAITIESRTPDNPVDLPLEDKPPASEAAQAEPPAPPATSGAR
jgi:chemotaxis protein MotB